jgi:tetratricopeptide (TPR) repeat protein
MVRLIALLLAVAFVALPSSAVLAQSEEISEENEERARQLFQAGDEHYANGRYEDALAAFEEAYALSGRPLLLFNMANAQERTGMYDEAIASLERYLPDADEGEASRIETRLTSLRSRAARVRDMTSTPDPVETPPDEPGISPVGPILLGVGGAALIGGLVLALRANSARSDLDELCTERGEQRFCQAEAESAQTRDRRSSIAADALFVAGAAAVGVGLYFLLRSTDEEEPANTVDAVASPDGGYARWSHAF